MLYALISDVHSNLEALSAVFEDIGEQNPDKTLFLGDAVGYGPNPNECVDILRNKVDMFLGGNHDWAAVDKTAADYFNPYAREAVEWTAGELTRVNKKYLFGRPAEAVVDELHLAHSTPMDPEEWRYIMSRKEAIDNYHYIKTDLCFIGHSHQPNIIEYKTLELFEVHRYASMRLHPDRKHIINIGSVGQPRDADPDACWVLYDSDLRQVEYRRVHYDITATQQKMAKIGLPEYLIERLALGR